MCYIIQAMRLIAENECAKHFFRFFFIKNKKAGPARKKAGKLYMLLFF